MGSTKILREWLQLSPEQFTVDQRQKSIEAVLKWRAKYLIKKADDLQTLFDLSLEQLTLEQRKMIWQAIGEERLGQFIPDQTQRDRLNPFLRRSTPSPHFFGEPSKQSVMGISPTLQPHP